MLYDNDKFGLHLLGTFIIFGVYLIVSYLLYIIGKKFFLFFKYFTNLQLLTYI